MMRSQEKKYGFWGWKEILDNRKEILDEYNRSKNKNQSRPIKTAHGNAGEAALRKWLTDFLPKKYGVTSGYIIPDVIVDGNYTLYHYDIIIYDILNSPVLWLDADYDTSDLGKKRAIPAKYIHSVIEVKSTFNSKNVKDSIDKLSEINTFSKYLPSNFSCSTIYLELNETEINKTEALRLLLPNKPFKYWGGMILSCSINSEMTGLILFGLRDSAASDMENTPLVKDIEKLNIKLDEDGNVTINEQGAAVMLMKTDTDSWSVSKQYIKSVNEEQFSVLLSWSYNQFARFQINLLTLLEGKSLYGPQPNGIMFGQVFDHID